MYTALTGRGQYLALREEVGSYTAHRGGVSIYLALMVVVNI